MSFDINHIKLRNFAVVAIDFCKSWYMKYTDQIIYKWSVMIYGSLEDEFYGDQALWLYP